MSVRCIRLKVYNFSILFPHFFCISIVVVVFITIVIYDDIILVCVILLLLSMFDVLYSHVSIVIFIFGAKGVLD